MKCERCGYESPDLLDYCGNCGKNLCDKCMAKGHCGHVPALSGNEADHGEDEYHEACLGCNGSGQALYSPLYPVICPRCGGTGVRKE